MSDETPHPRPRPQPTPEPAAGGAAPVADPTTSAGTEVDAASANTGAVPQARGSRALLTRALQLVCVLLVAAGVTVFVLARNDRDSAVAKPGTSAELADPRARLNDPAAAQGFLSAAVTEVVAVTQSDYRNLDNTLQAGLPITTGAFRSTFQKALTGTGAARRRTNHSITSLEVLASGIGRMNAAGTTARVLIFGRVTQNGTDIPKGKRTVVTSVGLTMERRGQQYLISNVAGNGPVDTGIPPGTYGLRLAARAAGTAVVDTLSYARASYTADLVRARTDSTGALQQSISAGSGATLKRMQQGGYDLAGKVTAIALQRASDDAAVFLVGATGSRVADNGSTSLDVDAHYAVTVQRIGTTTWLASMITPIGSS